MKKQIIKILIIVGAITIIALIFFLIWKKITAPPTITPPPEELPIPTVPAPPTAEPPMIIPDAKIALKKISSYPVFDFWAVPETREVLYIDPSGQVWSAKEGPDLEVSREQVSALNSTEVSPDKRKALVSFGNPKLPEWGVFDLLDKVWRPLPANIIQATWSTEENEIFVITANEDGSRSLAKYQLFPSPELLPILGKFNLRGVSIKTLSPNFLLIKERSSGLIMGRAWELDIENLKLNLLFTPARGLDIRISQDRKAIFKFSSVGGFKILGENLEITTPLFFNTFPQKCEKEQGKVFCFAPTNTPENAVLPDDYFMKKFYTTDILYKINLETDETTPIIVSGEGIPNFDGINPQYLNNKLYFINRYDGHLYELTLP